MDAHGRLSTESEPAGAHEEGDVETPQTDPPRPLLDASEHDGLVLWVGDAGIELRRTEVGPLSGRTQELPIDRLEGDDFPVDDIRMVVEGIASPDGESVAFRLAKIEEADGLVEESARVWIEVDGTEVVVTAEEIGVISSNKRRVEVERVDVNVESIENPDLQIGGIAHVDGRYVFKTIRDG